MVTQAGKSTAGFSQTVTLVTRNIDSLGKLSLALAQDKVRCSKAGSQLARFKLWAGSLGAHRKAGARSLDYRLRDASTIREHAVKLLTRLEEAVRNASTASSDPIVSANEDRDSLDLELIEYFKDDEESNQSELDLALADISHLIDCLLRLSIAISNPAPHDQFMSRVGVDTLAYYEPFDIKHVQAKFPHMKFPLAERLGRAMTTRRHFFKYRKEHHDRILDGIDGDGGPGKYDDQTTVASSIPGHYKDSRGENPWIESDARSEISGTSYAPSSNDPGELRVPPIPKRDPRGNFLCTLCYQWDEVSSRKDWKRHVFRDLQPYICLAPSCLAQDHKFSRRSDWVYHMKQAHWRTWGCPYRCQQVFDASDKLRYHLQTNHTHDLALQEQETLETMCSQEDLEKASGPCPFCNEHEISSATQYSKHVGNHLEQLALFALPGISNGDDESGDQKPNAKEEGVVQEPKDQDSPKSSSDSDDESLDEEEKLQKSPKSLIEQGREPDASPTQLTNREHMGSGLHDNIDTVTGILNPQQSSSDAYPKSLPKSGTNEEKGARDEAGIDSTNRHSSGERQSDTAKWRWTCGICGFSALSYEYNVACPNCSHNRDSGDHVFGLP